MTRGPQGKHLEVFLEYELVLFQAVFDDCDHVFSIQLKLVVPGKSTKTYISSSSFCKRCMGELKPCTDEIIYSTQDGNEIFVSKEFFLP